MPARGRGSDAASGPQRVFLHIGPPKTGTTYVQSILFGNRRKLRQAGVLLPGRATAKHFGAVGDLRGRRRGKRRNSGAWDRLAAEARAWPGTSVISCEWFAFCTHEQVERALGSFGAAEVHVVITLRDLGRIVPAVWQEQVKNGKVFTFTEFLDLLEHPNGVDDFGTRFWRTHDTRQLLDRWARDLPDDRVHLVTLPRSGADPDELWRRFGSLFLADLQPYDTSGVRANPGLRLAEVEVLRRVNDELDGRMRKNAHAPLVKHLLTGELTKQAGGGKLRLPTSRLDPLVSKAEEIVSALAVSGHPVVGDLDDLKVDATTGGDDVPERPADADVSAAAVKSLAALLRTMQADGAHRRKVWRNDATADRASGGAGRGGRPGGPASSATTHARRASRRAKGLLRRVSARMPARKSARG